MKKLSILTEIRNAILFFFLITSFASFMFSTKAQVVSFMQFSVTPPISVCTDTFNVEIGLINNDTIQYDDIAISHYFNDGVQLIAIINQVNVDSIDTVNLSVPVFSTDSILPSDTIFIDMQVFINCSDTSAFFSQFTDSTVFQWDGGNQTSVEHFSYAVGTPNVRISSITPQMHHFPKGRTVMRQIKICNTGNGSSAALDFVVDYDSSVIADSFVACVGVNQAVVTLTNDNTIHFTDSIFEILFDTAVFLPDTCIILKEYLRALGCTEDAVLEYQLFSICGTDICNATNSPQNNTVKVVEVTGTWNLDVIDYISTDTCGDTLGEIQYALFLSGDNDTIQGSSDKIVNSFRFRFDSTVYDIDSICIGNMNVEALGITDSSVNDIATHLRVEVFFDSLNIDPDGPGGLSTIPNLPNPVYNMLFEGDTVFITIKGIRFKCDAMRDDCPYGGTTGNQKFIGPHGLTFQEMCDPTYTPVPLGAYEILDDSHIEFSNATLKPPDIEEDSLGASYSTVQFCIDGNDIEPWIDIDFSESGESFISCPDAYYELVITLPNGYSLQNSNVIYSYPYANPVNDTVFIGNDTIVGDTLYIRTDSLGRDGCFEFLLEVSCDSANNVDPIGNEPDLTLIELRSYCDSTCQDCYIPVACDSACSWHHCLGECEGAVMATGREISFERTSFGWTDVCMTSAVTDTTPGIVLDHAYVCDTVCAWIPGSVGEIPVTGIDTVLVQMSYTSPDSSNIFEFSHGYFVIDTGSGNDTCFNIQPNIMRDTSSGMSQFIIQFPVPQSCVPAASWDSSDAVSLKAFFVIRNPDKLLSGFYDDFNLRFEHQAIDATNDSIYRACDSWGRYFSVIVTDIVQVTTQETVPPSNCQFSYVYGFTVTDGLAGIRDYFPNEYRPIVRFNEDVKIILQSDGLVYDTSITSSYTWTDGGVIDLDVATINGDSICFKGSDYFNCDGWTAQDSIGNATTQHFTIRGFITECPFEQIEGAQMQVGYVDFTDASIGCGDTITNTIDVLNEGIPPSNLKRVYSPEIPMQIVSDSVCWFIDVVLAGDGELDAIWMADTGYEHVEIVDVLNLSDPTDTLDFVNGIWQIDSFAQYHGTDSLRLRMCALVECSELDSTHLLAPETLTLFWGAGCPDWPDSLFSDSCALLIDTVVLRPLQARLDVSIEGDTTTIGCDTAYFELLFESTDTGTVNELEFWFSAATGFELDTVLSSYIYPAGATAISLPAPTHSFGANNTQPGWNLDSLILNNQGLPGITLDSSEITLQLYFIPSCGATTNGDVQFTTSAKLNCSPVDTFFIGTYPVSCIHSEPDAGFAVEVDSFGNTAVACVGETLIFTSNATEPTLIHTWQIEDSIYTTPNVTHTFTTASTQAPDTVFHVVTDTLGCSDSQVLPIFIVDYPNAQVLVDSTECPWVLSTFYPDTFYISYQWLVDEVADSNGIGATYQPMVSGSYSVSVTFADECRAISPPLFVEPLKGSCIETSDATFIKSL